MNKLTLTVACPPYDRVQPLMNGMIVPEGMNLNWLPMEVEEVFWRQMRHAEFDVSEASFSSYSVLRAKGDDRFIAIPVFPSKFFRHSCIYINTNKGINKPEDLKGKVVGLPEWQLTAMVWQRGLLSEEFGVQPRDISWRNGGLEEPGRVEKVAVNLPEGVHVEPIGPDQTLSNMLHTGEIDAMLSNRIPSSFLKGSPNVARLFPNYREVEEEYFNRTKIFPIMHTIVIKRDLYEANRWIAASLFKAFCQAKAYIMERFDVASALYTTLPWQLDEVERTRKTLGPDWWSYGIDANRNTLETFFKIHHEQGLSGRLLTIEEMFAPETLSAGFKI